MRWQDWFMWTLAWLEVLYPLFLILLVVIAAIIMWRKNRAYVPSPPGKYLPSADPAFPDTLRQPSPDDDSTDDYDQYR